MSAIRQLDSRLYPECDGHWAVKRFRRHILDRLREDYSILDLGAGRGATEEMNFRGLVKFVAGVDPDPAVHKNPFLDESRTLTLPEGKIPYPDNSFDLVFSNSFIEHVQDPKTFFREAFRVLKPRGVFLSITSNRRHYIAMIARLTPQSFHEYINEKRGVRTHDTFPTFYMCNTPQDVENLAQDAGFEIVEIQMWESRPEYLRFSVFSYFLGYLYERIVNGFPVLSRFRCVMVFTLQRPGRDQAETVQCQ